MNQFRKDLCHVTRLCEFRICLKKSNEIFNLSLKRKLSRPWKVTSFFFVVVVASLKSNSSLSPLAHPFILHKHFKKLSHLLWLHVRKKRGEKQASQTINIWLEFGCLNSKIIIITPHHCMTLHNKNNNHLFNYCYIVFRSRIWIFYFIFLKVTFNFFFYFNLV